MHPLSRRSTELGLVIMAGVITAAAYVLASLGKNSTIPPIIVPFFIALLGLLLIAHLATRLLARGADATLLPLAAMLHGIGYVMITRLSDRLAGLQTVWSFIAIGSYIATLVVVQRAPDLARLKWTFFVLGAVLLLSPLVPGVGRVVGGARIWVRVGPINFQPGEFAKILLALFFAGYLYERRELIAASTWHIGPLHLPEPRYLLPVLAAWGFAVVVLVGEQDLGTSLLFFTLFVVMMWVATERPLFLVVGFVLFGAAAYGSFRMFHHVQDRVHIWLDPWSQYTGKGYQIVQGIFAVGDGGLGGAGLGQGHPNLIPAVQTDFIFAGIAEELGLFGATAVLMSFMLIVGAGLRVAIKAERPFEKLLATGLTALLGVQAFIIMGGVIRVVPLTGITLPFVSYGGSSLVANYVLLALLIRVSDSTARRIGELPDDPTINEKFAAWQLRRHLRKHPEAAGVTP